MRVGAAQGAALAARVERVRSELVNDVEAMQARIAEIQRAESGRKAEREAQAAANQERVRRWSPEFAMLVRQLRESGMFGKITMLEIP